jgi:hypothetical protein
VNRVRPEVEAAAFHAEDAAARAASAVSGPLPVPACPPPASPFPPPCRFLPWLQRYYGPVRFPAAMRPASVFPRWLPPPVTIPADAAGPPRFRRDPLARDVASPVERWRLAIAAPHMLPSAQTTASASTMSSFRGSIPHPVQSLCTLRTPRCRDARNTRYRAARYALPGRDLHPLDRASFAWRTVRRPLIRSADRRAAAHRPARCSALPLGSTPKALRRANVRDRPRRAP